jgi:hypothetical protein
MVISDSVSTAFCTPNLVWRATEQYGGIRRKIKASRGDARVLYGAVWGHKGQGFPGFEATTWHALVAPAGTPKDVIATLHRATAATVNDPPVRKALTDLGVDVVGGTPEELRAYVKSEIPKWAEVVRASGARVD